VTALGTYLLGPELRVVLGLFDPDLAARVERALRSISRNVGG
jgi:hypothetical protein